MTITKERLAEIKARVDLVDGQPWPKDPLQGMLRNDMRALLDEVERLKNLLKYVEFNPVTCDCNFCDGDSYKTGHTPGCPAFTPTGEVK